MEWEIKKVGHPSDDEYWIVENQNVIAKIANVNNNDKAKANAQLIAAAPELLEAMKELFKQCAMIHKYGGEICNQKKADLAIKNAKKAIAEAESK